MAIAYESMVAGTWSRLKVCPADDCQWAFYDHSKNRSGTWCSMQVCGNRAKVRAYRERRAGTKSGSSRGQPGACRAVPPSRQALVSPRMLPTSAWKTSDTWEPAGVE